jgi:hypothetical protein
VRHWLRHAFAIESPEALSPRAEEAELVDRLARAVVRRGLQTPAILALECSQNLHFLASQTLVFFAPIMQILFNREQYAALTQFLERRGSLEYVCRRIEFFVEAGPSAIGRQADSPHAGDGTSL